MLKTARVGDYVVVNNVVFTKQVGGFWLGGAEKMFTEQLQRHISKAASVVYHLTKEEQLELPLEFKPKRRKSSKKAEIVDVSEATEEN